MGTRALYTFRDQDQAFNVYKHWDGDPRGAAAVIRHTIDYFAWPLNTDMPRFEADEFAAAFCAAGKTASFANYLDTHKTHRGRRSKLVNAVDWHMNGRAGGNVRLMPQGDPDDVALRNCRDIEFRYELMMGTGNYKLIIKAIRWSAIPHQRVTFWYGPFEDFEKALRPVDLFAKTGYVSIYKRPPGEGEKGQRKAPLIEHESTGNVA